MIDILCVALIVIAGLAIGVSVRSSMKISDLERALKRETASTIDYNRQIKELKQELLDAQRDASIWRKRYHETGMGDG